MVWAHISYWGHLQVTSLLAGPVRLLHDLCCDLCLHRLLGPNEKTSGLPGETRM